MNTNKLENTLVAAGSGIETIVARLLASSNACDLRKGRDLRELIMLSRSIWKGRFDILDSASTADRSLAIICGLKTPGLIWRDGRCTSHDRFHLALALPHNYPMSLPTAQFFQAVPWCCHVVHEEFQPDENDLPPDLQGYLRQGHGYCCALRSSEWEADADALDLAILLWHISRIVSMDKVYGEDRSLNPDARDYAFRLADEGRLPLGAVLPYPREIRGDALPVAIGEEDTEDDIEWV